MNHRSLLAFTFSIFLSLTLVAAPGKADAVTIKLGTVAPRDSSFHRILDTMGKAWRAQNVELRIYPGGVRGGEAEMVQLMRNGALDAALLTGVGLGTIDPSVEALQSMPLMFRSLEELDYVAERLRPQQEKLLRKKGFVVLFWGDAGWVRIFSTKPVTRPDDLRRLKLFTWTGDVPVVDLYKANGFRPVPLETNDILPALQTGMIEAVPMPPYVALMTQVFTLAPNMIDLQWAPLLGALVVSEKGWNKLTPNQQRVLADASREAGRQMKARNRLESEMAVEAMKKRNLRVNGVSPQIEAEWRTISERTYPRLRGQKIPADVFDEITRLVADYRRDHGTAP